VILRDDQRTTSEALDRVRAEPPGDWITTDTAETP
jgi:hypothetical protein